MNRTKKSLFWGVGAGLLLLAFYFLILTLANSFSHAKEQIGLLWFWILALVVGFSLQVGLYTYIHQKIKQNQTLKNAKKEIAVTAGISTTSMIACCAHHLVDVLPILGLSAVFLFLAGYQVFFLLLGIVSNVIGIIFMLEIVKKHALFESAGFLDQITRFNMKMLRNWAIVGSSFALLAAFFLLRNNQKQNSLENLESSTTEVAEVLSDTANVSLPSRINNEGGLSIEVQPIDFSFANPVQFEIFLNTHQGNLDFDLTQKAVLLDDENNQYLPFEWQGGQSGHHLSGKLVFPVLQRKTTLLKLVIKDAYGVKEREFLWNLS